MTERRLQQYALAGSFLANLPLEHQAIASVDTLLKIAGVVPESAQMTHTFVLPTQDVWVYRYGDESFAVVDDFGEIDTTIVTFEARELAACLAIMGGR